MPPSTPPRDPARDRLVQLLHDCITEFADTDFQRRVWVEGSARGVMSSFAEAVCGVFDDASARKLLLEERASGAWTAEATQAVEAFLEQVEAILPSLEGLQDEQVIADPLWPSVVQAARRASAALGAMVGRAESQADPDRSAFTEGEIVRVTLHDKDGAVLFEGVVT